MGACGLAAHTEEPKGDKREVECIPPYEPHEAAYFNGIFWEEGHWGAHSLWTQGLALGAKGNMVQ